MKCCRLVSGVVLAMLAGVVFTSIPVHADISVRIDIGNAPPPPRFVFRARPHEQYFPDQRVYLVDDPRIGDDDCFRYGGYYWLFHDGYWYRSRSWRGRFVVIEPRYVPAVFYRVPPTRWKHHPSGPPSYVNQNARRSRGMDQGGGPPGQMKAGGPPGQMKKGGGPPGQNKKGGKGGDKGGKGNDKHGGRGGN
ncbi:MAG TPA: hypothetical protein VFK69_07205 [Candidatus Eisenbacteria bacterium]|nr:hypothetical protein [Candidatus Eisenbacteria bacterium]